MEPIVGRRAGLVRLRHRQDARRDLGIWDDDLYDYETVYDTDSPSTRPTACDYHETQMTHAMLFTGVDVVDGAPAPLAGREQLGRRDRPTRASGR